MANLSLHPDHLADLRKSGLSDETIAQAGVYSVRPADIGKITRHPQVHSLLAFPYSPTFTRYKVFPTQLKLKGKGYRYTQMAGSGVHLYVPPMARAAAQNPKETLYIVEGEKKALKACQEGLTCVAIGGLWNWRQDKKLIDDIQALPLRDRRVVLVPDSDVWGRPDLVSAVSRLAQALRGAEAAVESCVLPEGDGQLKVGLDDYLLTHTVESLCALEFRGVTDGAPPERSYPRMDDIGYTARQLQHMTLPTLVSVADDLVVEGLTLLAGTSGIGKSYLLLQLAIAATTGGKFLGQWPTHQTDVLYLGTEDNQRRMDDRMSRLWEDAGEWPDNLTFVHRPQTLDTGLIGQISEWLDTHPKARLIIVDLWGDVKPPRGKNGDWYTEDRAAARMLANLANGRHVAIIATHHTNRLKTDDPFDNFHGGNGLLGAADTKMILLRSTDTDTTWHIKGRDVPKQSYTLELTEGIWLYRGEATETAASPAMADLLKYLALNPDAFHSAAEVARALGRDRMVVKSLLSRAFRRGLVSRAGDGLYKTK
jgi:hypothetical protein